MAKKEKPFEVKIGSKDLKLTTENLMILLFRKEVYQDLDHLQVYNEDDESILDVWRNPELCRWIAGIAFTNSGIKVPKSGKRDTFRDIYGWNPRTLIRDKPDEEEIENYASVDIDTDFNNGHWDMED